MKKKVGLVLGAGGARGFMHLGVLKVLEKNNIKVDCISGCSMGAIIGGLYAAGADVDILCGLAENLTPKLIVDPVVPRKGLIAGKKALGILQVLLQKKTFAQLDIPLTVIAADIEKVEKVVLDKGDVTLALRASSSIPGIFVPVEHEGRILVDGAVLERLPIEEARGMGAEYIIAVDAWGGIGEKKVNNVFGVLLRTMDIFQDEVGRRNYYTEKADVYITADMTDYSSYDFDCARQCIEIGERAAGEAIKRIKTDLGSS